eukprot:GFYU01008146.1.p1 GENE.GFYU01008146.1~~GFYU01008146.1.p1  ORF type:complete len:103 (-),score=14.06 GFYU01008146.1:266-574(-)
MSEPLATRGKFEPYQSPSEVELVVTTPGGLTPSVKLMSLSFPSSWLSPSPRFPSKSFASTINEDIFGGSRRPRVTVTGSSIASAVPLAVPTATTSSSHSPTG